MLNIFCLHLFECFAENYVFAWLVVLGHVLALLQTWVSDWSVCCKCACLVGFCFLRPLTCFLGYAVTSEQYKLTEPSSLQSQLTSLCHHCKSMQTTLIDSSWDSETQLCVCVYVCTWVRVCMSMSAWMYICVYAL